MSTTRLMYAITLLAVSHLMHAGDTVDVAPVQAWTAEHSSRVMGVTGALSHIIDKHDYAASCTVNETRRALI